jgi:hypothetical protein
VSILPSADTARLIDELTSEDPLRRETATARLSIIGGRAVTRLLAVAGDEGAAVHARLAALQALEAIGDPRSAALARSLTDGSDVRLAVAAIGVLGVIAAGNSPQADKAFDQLTGVALNAAIDSDRRVAACAALEAQPRHVVRPILDALSRESAPAVQAHAIRAQAGDRVPIGAYEQGELPLEPAVFVAVLREEGAEARVTLLRAFVDRVRERERDASDPARAAQWMAVRGLLHQLLAARGSRLALYDLREAFERARAPLPVGFLAAAAAIGDASCLEPVAAAWIHAAAGATAGRGSTEPDAWWRDHLAEAFAAIVRREKLPRTHPAIRKTLEKFPAAAAMLGR